MTEKISSQPTRKRVIDNVSDILLNCEICFEEFSSDQRRPRCLNCLHTFCHCCLVQFAGQAKNESITCPTCGKVTNLAVGGVDSLGVNYTVENLLDIISESKTVPRLKKAKSIDLFQTCQICDEASSIEASHACMDCHNEDSPFGIPLCADCAEEHKTVRLFKGHECVEIDEFNRRVAQNDRLKCKVHTNKRLELFCSSCRLCICSQCLSEHQDHNVLSLSDASQIERSKFSSACEEIDECISQFQSHLDAANTKIFVSQDATEEVHTYIDRTVQTFISHLEEWRSITHEQLESVVIANNEKLVSLSQILESVLVLTKDMRASFNALSDDNDFDFLEKLSQSETIEDRQKSFLATIEDMARDFKDDFLTLCLSNVFDVVLVDQAKTFKDLPNMFVVSSRALKGTASEEAEAIEKVVACSGLLELVELLKSEIHLSSSRAFRSILEKTKNMTSVRNENYYQNREYMKKHFKVVMNAFLHSKDVSVVLECLGTIHHIYCDGGMSAQQVLDMAVAATQEFKENLSIAEESCKVIAACYRVDINRAHIGPMLKISDIFSIMNLHYTSSCVVTYSLIILSRYFSHCCYVWRDDIEPRYVQYVMKSMNEHKDYSSIQRMGLQLIHRTIDTLYMESDKILPPYLSTLMDAMVKLRFESENDDLKKRIFYGLSIMTHISKVDLRPHLEFIVEAIMSSNDSLCVVKTGCKLIYVLCLDHGETITRLVPHIGSLFVSIQTHILVDGVAARVDGVAARVDEDVAKIGCMLLSAFAASKDNKELLKKLGVHSFLEKHISQNKAFTNKETKTIASKVLKSLK